MVKFDKLKKRKSILLAFLIGGAFFSCVDDIGGVLLTDHANRLLSGTQGAKAWVRVSQTVNGAESDLSACSDHKSLIFARYSSVADTVFQVSQAFDCDGQVPILDGKLIYEADGNLDDHFLYTLSTAENVNAEKSNVDVYDITSQYLKIGFVEDENEIIEIYNFDEEVDSDLIDREPDN